MEKKANGGRIAYVDLAKGISIFLVIVGHASNNLDDPFYRVLLYAFHMPLFFLLSGMTVKPKQKYDWATWKQLLRKNLLVLMVPYFLWGVLYAQFSYVNVGRIAYGSWHSLTNAGTLTSLWYIPCLFLVRVELHLLLQLFGRFKTSSRLLAAIASVPAFAIGFLLPRSPIGYFWCFDVSFIALGFVLLGYAAKGLLDRLNGLKLGWQILGLALSCAALILGTACRQSKLTLVLLCNSAYGDPFFFFWNAISGSLVVLFIAMIRGRYLSSYRRRKWIVYIGQNTFAIFLLHKPILQKLIMLPLGLIGLDAWNVWVVLPASLVALVICCLLMRLIDRYIPQLLGKFPEPDTKPVDLAEEN